MPVKNLSQRVTFKAPPKTVYEALVDPKIHATFTGETARMDPKVGGRFEHYGGSLSGVVLVLEPGRRIVLAWRSSGWPAGHYSIAQFELLRVAGGTRLKFDQYGIPAGDYQDIADGWKTYYWAPLKEYLEG
jgi:activator of HSP90 ATPase